MENGIVTDDAYPAWQDFSLPDPPDGAIMESDRSLPSDTDTGHDNPAIAGGTDVDDISKTDKLLIRAPKFLDADGNIDWKKWAPNGGRIPGTIREGQIIPVGTVIDRYGNKFGKYTSPAGIPYSQRALPYVENPNAYHCYEVLKPIDNVTISKIAEAFEQPGGGLQYELPATINQLIKDGFLREIKHE